MNEWAHVSSRDVPATLALAVAKQAHQRCGEFDGGSGNRIPAPEFSGSHQGHHVAWASIHIADVCNALKTTPEQLETLAQPEHSVLPPPQLHAGQSR